MEIGEDRPGGVLVLAPVGRVDTTTSAGLEERLLHGVAGGERRLVLDLARVEYISSAGLRVLLRLAKKMQLAEGHLVLCGLGDSVRQVFELAGFLPLFTIEADREGALGRLLPQGRR
jgi:anti-anti-sigma factor